MKTKTKLTVTAFAVSLLILGVMAWTTMETIDPWTAGNAYAEAAELSAHTGDTYMYAYKFDSPAFGATTSHTFVDGSYSITFTITTTADGYYFDWTSTAPITGAVIVKGGTLANVYYYAVPTSSDTGLESPWEANPQGKLTHKQISHITFCWNPEEEHEYVYDTVFAYYRGYAIDFIPTFMRWGWTNPLAEEGTYTFELWTGAGRCDLSKGTQVGTVDVTYSSGTVTCDFNMFDGNILDEASVHIYAGAGMFPLNHGTPTVAPGQYYIEPNLSGPIYVIVHCKVGIPVP